MSDKRKTAIRERMARTGESYSTARMHVLAERPYDPKAGPSETAPKPSRDTSTPEEDA